MHTYKGDLKFGHIISRVHNKYADESILLPYTLVEGCIVKFWHNDKMLWFVICEQP